MDKHTLKQIRDKTKENDVLFSNRLRSLQKFFELPMPSPKLEEWKYTNVLDFDINKFELSGQEIEYPDLNDEVKEKNVVFCDIKTALTDHFELLADHLPNSLFKNEDKFTAMHAAFWNDGIFIHVPKNTVLDLPLRNNFKVSGKGGIFSHTIIILEENSVLNYVEEHLSEKGDYLALRNDVIEIFAKQNSVLNFHNLQTWEKNVFNVSNWKAKLEKDAQVNFIFGQFGGKFSRVKIDTLFCGQGSSSLNKGVFFGKKDQHFDITTNSFHSINNTTGDILVKDVMDDNATSVYRGMIKITKEAQQTNSFLTNHSLILSDDAVSNSIPSLEIDANDVKASHGATLGKPDEEEIFYLMSRGLKREEAIRLLVLGYFADVTEQIKIDDLKLKFEDALVQKVK